MRWGLIVDWYSGGFVPGARYMDEDGQFTLEYAGVLTAKVARGLVDHPEFVEAAEPTELVHVFMLVMDNVSKVLLYTHTKADADQGYSFVSLADMTGDSRPKPKDRAG